jgi:formate hydrogenlyase subunit 3/multisubunit Na+/H+ antiporter MnhD subunit
MAMWAVIIVSGICSFFSFSVAFLAFRAGYNSAALLVGFGLFFAVFFAISFIKVAAKRSPFLKRLDEKLSGEPKQISFVPHWFMMTAIIITGIGILAAILIPIFFR